MNILDTVSTGELNVRDKPNNVVDLKKVREAKKRAEAIRAVRERAAKLTW